MMRKILTLTLLALVGMALTGCATLRLGLGEQVRGSRNVTTEVREVGAFTAIDISGFGEVVVAQGEAERLSVETDDNLQAIVTSEVRGDTLYLGIKPGVVVREATRIRFAVTVTDLERLTISGAADVRVPELRAEVLTVDNSGVGAVTIAGSVEEQRVTLTGAGSYDGAELVSERATVTISGMGDVVVRVAERLDANLSGAGSIEYIGDPEVHQQVSGMGEVRRRSL